MKDMKHFGRGISKQSILFIIFVIIIIIVPLYNLLFLTASPSAYFTPTPRPAPAAGASPTPVAGWWCEGVWERISDWIEICVEEK